MGLVFSWLWDQREAAPRLLVVTTETQVSVDPSPNLQTCWVCFIFLWLGATVGVAPAKVEHFVPACLCSCSPPLLPPSTPHPSFPHPPSFPPTICSLLSPSSPLLCPLSHFSLLLSSPFFHPHPPLFSSCPMVAYGPLTCLRVHTFIHVSLFYHLEETGLGKVGYWVLCWDMGGCICLLKCVSVHVCSCVD